MRKPVSNKSLTMMPLRPSSAWKNQASWDPAVRAVLLFDEAKCAQAFSADKTYACSTNFWSLDLAQLKTQIVPILMSFIEGLKSCAPMPHHIVGRAASAQHAVSELKNFKVVVCSPPYAYI